MKRVLKFSVALGGLLREVEIPMAARIKHVAWDPNTSSVALWATVPVDSQEHKETRWYQVFTTGEEVPSDFAYVGTATVTDHVGQWVYHVFEKVSP